MLARFPLLSRCLAALVLAGVYGPLACAETGNEAALKTAFLFNFFKFIHWPVSTDAFSLCTTDNDGLGDSLDVLESKTIDDKPIIIQRGVAGKALKDCQMVYISHTDNTAKILRDLKGLAIVTVSDKPNFVDQGGVIGLAQKDNRLGFEVNLDTANANGIHVMAQMLKLAKRVVAQK